jgi:hypothetical protein
VEFANSSQFDWLAMFTLKVLTEALLLPIVT